MIVEQIWTANGERNFQLSDRLRRDRRGFGSRSARLSEMSRSGQGQGWNITQILNTHHAATIPAATSRAMFATNAPVLAHRQRQGPDSRNDARTARHDTIKSAAPSKTAMRLDTPGPHDVAYLYPRAWRDPGAVLRRHPLQRQGRQLRTMAATRTSFTAPSPASSSKLPATTLIYPGHDYIVNNLKFTLDREPDNAKAASMLPGMEKQDTNKPLVTTL